VDGGFDSQLFLFDSGGTEKAMNDDADRPVSVLSGKAWDAYISITLNIGFYTAIINQYDSEYVSGDIFSGIWTDAIAEDFMDVSDSQRTSAFAFDISGEDLEGIGGSGVDTTPAPIPEPTSIALFGLALAGFAARRKNS
ncbi:MAG: PEP-CTERM sorting domain-containing protein, partial [Colwellia sp.]|nr:PEP-CTERM sorting domain-containing protein [Colwellia sp.]